MNTKQKGNIAIGEAIAHYTKLNYIVSLPLNDSQDYDIIIDNGISLKKVQVKFTSSKSKSNKFIITLKSVSGSSRKVYKTLKDSKVDLLFCVTSENQKYEYDVKEITQNNAIILNENYLIG